MAKSVEHQFRTLLIGLHAAWTFVHGSRDAELKKEFFQLLRMNWDVSESLNLRIHAAIERAWPLVNIPFVSDSAKSNVSKALKVLDLKTFEVTAAGFDAATDETDGRVLWVQAVSPQAVESAIEGTGAVFHGQVDVSEDIDYLLPEGSDALRACLVNFRDAPQLTSRQRPSA